ncbi:GNAT family N-acetyltransferase [Tropicimonas sp.]|uniref:GNAT family N-acetyltransferase n=1 Tax=Tropicimonas sp. TaxID=2067044 RepID=UPI003A8A8A19
MTGSGHYSFRAAGVDDLDLLRSWQAAAHVRRWWGNTDQFDREKLDDRRVSRWIVSFDGRPFAYMQDYAVHGWGGHHFDYLPEGSRGIDQYIGESDMIGRGHGTGFIGQRLRALFRLGAPVVATDPHPENAHAIAAYRKLGFRIAGPAIETAWGIVLPMEIRNAPDGQ